MSCCRSIKLLLSGFGKALIFQLSTPPFAFLKAGIETDCFGNNKKGTETTGLINPVIPAPFLISLTCTEKVEDGKGYSFRFED